MPAQSGTPITPEVVRSQLALFAGGTGGFDSWITGDHGEVICQRLCVLQQDPLSCSQLNQLLALARQPEISSGFFKYYWLACPSHLYDVTRIPGFDVSYERVDRILSLDQLRWGLYRIYIDALLCFGTIQAAHTALRTKDEAALQQLFRSKRYDSAMMAHRGPALPLEDIAKDDRYLIAEQACKSFEPPSEEEANLLSVLKGAWLEHASRGGGRIQARVLLESAYVRTSFSDRQQQFVFAADDMLDAEVATEEELVAKYQAIMHTYGAAREKALRNSKLYLSMANDLDAYVATSMRNREQFRQVARICESIFSHSVLRHLHLRYFDPTLSAARGHEDKGLIECLMVKCAKVLIYTAGERDSYGKDAEAAMALSLGKPVIFLCDEEDRLRFFHQIHPLSRLIDFETGVAVGAMATSSVDDAAILLARIFENDMRYELQQPKNGYLRLSEQLTGSTVRLQTNDDLLRDTFWNCYHRPNRG